MILRFGGEKGPEDLVGVPRVAGPGGDEDIEDFGEVFADGGDFAGGEVSRFGAHRRVADEFGSKAEAGVGRAGELAFDVAAQEALQADETLCGESRLRFEIEEDPFPAEGEDHFGATRGIAGPLLGHDFGAEQDREVVMDQGLGAALFGRQFAGRLGAEGLQRFDDRGPDG